METLTLGAAWYLIFVISTTFHEAGHAFMALKLGDRTAYMGGLVTLNPIPHIQRSPIGMVLVPLLVFMTSQWMIGWASAPYDPAWAYRYPRRSAWMSLAGPSTNFALMMTAACLIWLGLILGVFQAPDQIVFTKVTMASNEYADTWLTSAAVMVSICFTLNLILCIFNLLPLPPLDGSGLVPFFVDQEQARRYHEFLSQPGISLFGLFLAWMLFQWIFDPIWTLSLNLLYPGAGYH